jgi:ubiquinone/menaquinone biosynthesis C-methylase UbiE
VGHALIPAEKLASIKGKMRATWMAGDFGQIARHIAREAEGFVSRLDLGPGTTVLDVACGTGNLAIPAARTGAIVTGIDIAPNLIQQARERAAAEQLGIVFEEGDAEALPYADGQFEVVMSMFGAMFAPRPDVVAAELARVCRSGGVIAMANWTPHGFIGKMAEVGARYLTPAPGISSPFAWGDWDVFSELLKPYVAKISGGDRMAVLEFPFPPREVVQLFREYFGPVKMAFSRLDAEAQNAYRNDLERLWAEHNEAEGNATRIQAEYLEASAIRR